MLEQSKITRALFAGLAATTAMTALMMAAPMMGMPPMNIGKMLGSMLGGITALGWMAHYMVGALLALGFAAVFVKRLPGPVALRGMLFSLAPWLMAQLVVMPMMGKGLFSGSMALAVGSLMGHLVYGAVLGLVYGREGAPSASRAAASHA